MSEDDEIAFREQLARDTGDAIYNSWVILAEALVQAGVIQKEILIATLKGGLDHVAGTHGDSLTHYVLHRAWMSYSMDDSQGPDGSKRPVWLRGVVDGGKNEE